MSYLIPLILAIVSLAFTMYMYRQQVQSAPVRRELEEARASNRLKGMHHLRMEK